MKSILVVEDDPTILDLVVILLEREGYRVKAVSCGEDAVAEAGRSRPDLVLMDLQLPGIDGLEATRMLKAEEPLRNVPVVALSAQALKEDRERAVRAGCDAFITKPLSARPFVQEVARLLGLAGGGG